MPFQIIRNDITKVKADAIVNTANPDVAVGRGTDCAIYHAAGRDRLLAARKKIGIMHPGQAAHTPAFNLDAKYIIHTVGPAWIDGNHDEREILHSSVGWLYNSLEETRRYARLTAEVTHNHPEGIKGAEAVASAIFMARNGASKEEIKKYIIQEFDYDLSRTCDEIRPGYHHIESCQETVPEALTAFMEGTDFEDVVRTAVSLGGDCDTLTCIAASIAEAFYGLPDNMRGECRKRLPKDMLGILDRFDERRGDRR